ncbi:protein-L-isoaspartate(D-aspartate) O-methyltransferase [Sediminibacterium sp. WSJ-3]|nr:protein-L-isoaspartate(D-aspartate) O-methyltransferase [Sediminibacterium soli]
MVKADIDTEKQQRLRTRLMDTLRSKGIQDTQVLNAIAKVPRHFFVGEEQQPYAYEDKPLPIGEGQTISQPYTVAYQTELLQVQPGQKVLEIGTGSGYQSAILASLGVHLYSLERQRKLFEKNESFAYLQSLPDVHFYYADGHHGLAEEAPFDRILLTAAARIIPGNLLEQLAPMGLLVAPVGGTEGQQMVRMHKSPDGSIQEELFDLFYFVPMLPGTQ